MKTSSIIIDGLTIEITRKRVKRLNLRIYPPEGRIRISAPARTPDRDIRAFVRAKRAWIDRHLAQAKGRPSASAPRYRSGETHYYQGRPYKLCVTVRDAPPRVTLRSKGTMEMIVPPGTDPVYRERVLIEWYRACLKDELPALVAKWETVVGVKVDEARVKRMKTRWGSCNPRARRIWVNLELAKRPVRCLEYVTVHEMVHLLEARHNARFYALLDRFMPGWRAIRAELEQAGVGARL